MDNKSERKIDKVLNFSDNFNKVLAALALIITCIYSFCRFSYALNFQTFYGIPKLYVFNNFKVELIAYIVFFILTAVSLLWPFIISKINKYTNISLNKSDCLYYSFLVSIVTCILLYFLLFELVTKIGIINLLEKFRCWLIESHFKVLAIPLDYIVFILFMIIPIAIAIIVAKYSYDYLMGMIINYTKDDNNKKSPDDGYKFVIFDLNGFKNPKSKKGIDKDQIKLQVLNGRRLSDAVDYIMKMREIKKYKKDGNSLDYWSELNESELKYEDKIIDGTSSETITLYAQSKKNEKAKKLLRLIAPIILILLYAILKIYSTSLRPAYKRSYEVFRDEQGLKRIVVEHHNDKLITMGLYKINENGSQKNKDSNGSLFIKKYDYKIEDMGDKNLHYIQYDAVYNEGYKIITLNITDGKGDDLDKEVANDENKNKDMNNDVDKDKNLIISFAVKNGFTKDDLSEFVENNYKENATKNDNKKVTYWSTDEIGTDDYFKDQKDGKIDIKGDELVLYAQYK